MHRHKRYISIRVENTDFMEELIIPKRKLLRPPKSAKPPGSEVIPTLLVVVLMVGLGLYFLAATHAATPLDETVLQASLNSSRTPAIDGYVRIRAGTPLYISVNDAQATEVSFTVTDAAGEQVAWRTDRQVPFDLAGDSSPWRQAGSVPAQAWIPPAGDYIVRADVTESDGAHETYVMPVSVARPDSVK